jgi:hypothetical protein
MRFNRTLVIASLFFTAACQQKKADPAPAPTATATATQAAATVASAAPQAPAGSPPADGKYERVTVDGVTVPMIQVMNEGTIVLVDTDGKKPRSWEEQYKKKRPLLTGQFDLHKTNTNANDTFEDDAIDREGLWIIDAKGNLTRH